MAVVGRRNRRRREQGLAPREGGGFHPREGAWIDQLLVEQFVASRQKFGRDPGPDDPIIFDPDADEPIPMSYEDAEAAIVDAAHVVGIDPALIYAMQMTGPLLTDENAGLVDPADLTEWLDAVHRYRRLHG